MPDYPFDPIEAFWDALLSRDPHQIHSVYDPLDEATRQAVIADLARMAGEPGWHMAQAQSARAALKELGVLTETADPAGGEEASSRSGPLDARTGRKRHRSKSKGG